MYIFIVGVAYTV